MLLPEAAELTDLANAMKNGLLDSSGPGARRATLLLGIAIVLYAVLRLIAWHNTVLLDDTDSIVYLGSIDTYYYAGLGRDQQYRRRFDPVSTRPWVRCKTVYRRDRDRRAARVICSSAFCLVSRRALLTRRLDGNVAAAFAVLILAVNAPMISLSVSVLTEVSYSGTSTSASIYCGGKLRTETFSLGAAAALGLVFGLAFLNRTEGILYVVAIPIAVLASAGSFANARKDRPFPGLPAIAPCMSCCFLALAVPQILQVSSKMGAPALNGRVAWQALVTASPGRKLE